VLKGVSFDIKAGEKVGFVGRTGSGKTSLFLSLLRILEKFDKPGEQEGSISIDGIRIDKIGLHVLRKAISIIPQDPFILDGTLKYNIDPLNEYTEQEVESVLIEIGFYDTIVGQKDILFDKTNPNYSDDKSDSLILKNKNKEKSDYKCSLIQAGKLSLGQKQLLFLSKAVLKKPKILLMDEATSSIDDKTDSIIQKILRTTLKDSTLLTIAHRLKTIADYDKIIVLADGKVIEQGSPA
jgi:ABC-type multidrug transport system fused ATPase/permease subunit